MTERGEKMTEDRSGNESKGNFQRVSGNVQGTMEYSQGTKENFVELLKIHQRKYPLMEPQDYGKLIFQSEFGPEHMINDRDAVRDYLEEELTAMTWDASPQCPEEIGNGLCRFPLSACPSVESAALLTDLFLLTAEEYGGTAAESQQKGGGAEESRKAMKNSRGTVQGLRRKLELAKGLKIPGMEEWAEAWEEKGYPAVHHSVAYREAYHPHYRLLRKEYAGFFAALWEIYKLAEAAGLTKEGIYGQSVPHMIAAIDGRSGSGKTSFAGLISRLLPCNVVHMDDFYLPMEQRGDNWTETPGGNMDFTRLRSEVLLPAKAGEGVLYRPYSCQKGASEEAVPLPPCGLTIVEGSYSHHPLLTEVYDLKIFLTCSKQEQTRRLRAREGSYFSMFEERWIPMEENYFRCCNVEEESDLVLEV